MKYEKMKPEIKAKWLEALRSGEFEQSTGALCEVDGGYCCLGVLSELAVREGVAEKWLREEDEGIYHFGKKKGDKSSEFLPVSVRKWAGLVSDNPAVPKGNLAVLNDQHVPFSEIADLIEQHF